MLKKKILANFQRIIEFFTQKIVTKLSKVWVWDPGSEIRKKPIPNPGSRGQKGTGSRIRIHMFLGFPDPDRLVRGIDPDSALDPDLDHSIIMPK